MTTTPDMAQAPATPNWKALARQTWRAFIFRRVDWRVFQTGPWLLLTLFVLIFSISIAGQRIAINGHAWFNWHALQFQIAAYIVGLWLTYWATYSSAVSLSKFLTLTYSLDIASVFIATILTFLLNFYFQDPTTQFSWLSPFISVLLTIFIIAQRVIVWWQAKISRWKIIFTFTISGMISVLMLSTSSANLWREIPKPDPKSVEKKEFTLTQEAMEAQPVLLAQRLYAVQASGGNTPQMFAITFAPDSEEDVFMNEALMVRNVLDQRFASKDHSIALINNTETQEQWPWATPLNLERAIHDIAGKMDKDRDILFLHLTSHGAKDGELAADFWPMEVAGITPQQLKQWLDQAGIRYRVISISACFSGSWIAPLRTPDSLVMTAADADHTSYGCGRKSPLTFFGRAMYDEQLRKQTLDFEAAYRQAREIIRQREKAAGKEDGFSNPQISTGGGIRQQLAKLREALQNKEKVSD